MGNCENSRWKVSGCFVECLVWFAVKEVCFWGIDLSLGFTKFICTLLYLVQLVIHKNLSII